MASSSEDRLVPRLWGLGRRVAEDVGEHNLSIIAAGMAYNAVFALFPGLAALVSVYGLISDPNTVAHQIEAISQVLPADIARIIGGQLDKLASASGSRLSLSLALSLLIAFYSVGSGIKSMVTGLNVAYDAREGRGFIHLTLLCMGMAAGLVLVTVVSLGLVAVLPAVLSFLPFGDQLRPLVAWACWPVAVLLIVLTLSVIYRWGPYRLGVRWRFITWGAALCTALWGVGTLLLSVYVAHFGSYNQTYGSIGGAVVLLLWLYFSAFTVLLGAEVDAELEQRKGIPTSRESAQRMASDA